MPQRWQIASTETSSNPNSANNSIAELMMSMRVCVLRLSRRFGVSILPSTTWTIVQIVDGNQPVLLETADVLHFHAAIFLPGGNNVFPVRRQTYERPGF